MSSALSRRVALAFLLLPAAELAAQGPTLAALRGGIGRPTRADSSPVGAIPSRAIPSRAVPSGGTGRRVVGALLGTTVGLISGALIASKLPQGECGDDPGLCEAVQGAAIGSVLGATLGASLPAGNGACPFGARAWRGLLGSTVGYLFGFVIAGDPISGTLLGGPVGASLAATFGASRCSAPPDMRDGRAPRDGGIDRPITREQLVAGRFAVYSDEWSFNVPGGDLVTFAGDGRVENRRAKLSGEWRVLDDSTVQVGDVIFRHVVADRELFRPLEDPTDTSGAPRANVRGMRIVRRGASRGR